MTESNFSPPEVDELNEQMPAFEFVSRLATDESKAVYLVKQKSLDRRAAIKIYSPEHSRSPEFRESFAATTKVMAKLKHPNLIGVYDSGLQDDMLYLVTEFVAGKPLWNSTKGEPVHLKHVQPLVEGICVGMAHAHKNDICHGALSLKNILLDETRMPKIGGFSQASGDTSKLDPSALRFRAPELADEGAKPKPQSDIYSIGVILREMAVGQTEGVEALGEIEEIGPALKNLVEKATSPDPSKRHRTVEEFYEELLDAFDPETAKKAAKKPAGALLKTGAVQLKAPGAAGGAKTAGTKVGGAGGSTGRPGKPSTTPKAVVSVKPSSPMKIWVHIAIIIVLLFAIKVAWSAYKDKKARNEAERNRVVQTQELRMTRPSGASNYRPNQGNPRTNPNDSGGSEFPNDPDPVVPIRKKDVAKEFASLRFDLSRGLRGEMPEGTVELDNRYYCHVDIPMTWANAFWFAQKHGGHLAIPSAKATTEWMRKELASDIDSDFWVGAAKSGRYSWTLADGRPWRPKDPSISLGEYVAVGSQGQLVPAEGQAEKSFVMQWTKDGSNPGSLESLLKITKDSMSGPAPIYPPGTQNFGVRHYLYVPETGDWKKAVLTARASGGHLLVVGGIAEKFNSEKLTKDVEAPQGIWLGGFRLDDKGWRWTTGERWRSSDWPQDKATLIRDAALFMKPGGGWDEKSREEKASGFIIEWSEDHKNAPK